MKDLVKTYAPLVALLVGFGCYWMWQQVSNLREQTRLLAEQNAGLMQVLSNQCTAFLDGQGMQVVPKPVEPPVPEEQGDGEDVR